jgi:putative glycosyltransferase (exosortase G-associated)
MKVLNNEILFWLAWIIIPLIVEVIPAIGNFFFLLGKYFFKKNKVKELEYYPEITIIIPVYNSEATLKKCIASIERSTYENELITVILMDNGSKDNSFKVFEECQLEFPDLSMYWMTSNQGKSRALNKALFNSRGKYIINIDSDGRLEENALKNVVLRFENNLDVSCVTGVIFTERDEIDETKDFFLRQIRKLEYMEYCQAFLAGRNFNSELNHLFTISGAFSAFKKSTILKTFLYNTDTICEDTHITFQIKRQNKKVALCENAIFYVSPIDDMDKLYTQRQRWQIGELEVFHMFFKNNLKMFALLKESEFKTILFDHTFAFPRLIWYFVLLAMGIMNYSLKNIGFALFLIYILYLINSLLFYINISMFLKDFKEDKKYYMRKILYLLLMPFYNLLNFVIRFNGIINSITRGSSWKTFTFKEEIGIARDIIISDFSKLNIFRKKEDK